MIKALIWAAVEVVSRKFTFINAIIGGFEPFTYSICFDGHAGACKTLIRLHMHFSCAFFYFQLIAHCFPGRQQLKTSRSSVLHHLRIIILPAPAHSFPQ